MAHRRQCCQIGRLMRPHQIHHAVPQPGRRIQRLRPIALQLIEPPLPPRRVQLPRMPPPHHMRQELRHRHRLRPRQMLDLQLQNPAATAPARTPASPKSRDATILIPKKGDIFRAPVTTPLRIVPRHLRRLAPRGRSRLRFLHIDQAMTLRLAAPNPRQHRPSGSTPASCTLCAIRRIQHPHRRPILTRPQRRDQPLGLLPLEQRLTAWRSSFVNGQNRLPSGIFGLHPLDPLTARCFTIVSPPASSPASPSPASPNANPSPPPAPRARTPPHNRTPSARPSAPW